MAKNLAGILSGIIDFAKSRFVGFLPINSESAAMHKFSKTKSKTYLTKNETLLLNTGTKLKAMEVNKNAKALFKELINQPEELVKYIESNGTMVVRAAHIEKILLLIGEVEGFILPLTGIKALILTAAVNILSPVKVKVGFNSPTMFVMRNLPVNVYYLAHQFHHWLSYSNGLPGYDEQTNGNFKAALSPEFGNNDIKMMSIDEILSLKDAIARDLEAIQFVKEISRELIGQKISSDRLKNGESLSI